MTKNIFLLLLMLVCFCCKKEPEYNLPLLFTGEVTEIHEGGAVFSLKIADFKGPENIEFGFVWDKNPHPVIQTAEVFRLHETPKNGVFSKHISTTLEERVKYYVRAFIRESDDIIYGHEVSFISQGSKAPTIDNFWPKTGTFGDTITITGNHFSNIPGNNLVLLGEFTCSIISAKQDTLRVKVPQQLNTITSTLSVSILGNSISFEETFSLITPVFNDFSPKMALTGEILTISGNNFGPFADHVNVFIGGFKATVVNAGSESLEVKIPLQDTGHYPSRNAIVKIELFGEQHQFSETLLINDKWFRLGNSPITSSGSQGAPHTFVFNGKAYIGLENNKKLREYNPSSDSWTPLPDFPGVARQGGVGFLLNGKIYFGTGKANGAYVYDWWEYNIEQKTWLQKNNFSIGPRSHAVAYSFEDFGYMVTGGTSEIYRYNTDTDIWYKVFSFYPEGAMRSAVCVINSKHAFIGLGNVSPPEYSNRIYKLNMSFHNWQRVPDFPFASNNNSAIGFELDDVVFIKTKYNPHFYYYNADSNSWVKLQTDILTDIREGIAFSINGKAYAGLGYSNALWEYDPSR